LSPISICQVIEWDIEYPIERDIEWEINGNHGIFTRVIPDLERFNCFSVNCFLLPLMDILMRPAVPLDVAQDGVFIIGAYPTAKFATINRERDVPTRDINGPFSDEQYFDGSRIRPVKSGQELEQAYLEPLGLRREQCWQPAVLNIV